MADRAENVRRLQEAQRRKGYEPTWGDRARVFGESAARNLRLVPGALYDSTLGVLDRDLTASARGKIAGAPPLPMSDDRPTIAQGVQAIPQMLGAVRSIAPALPIMLDEGRKQFSRSATYGPAIDGYREFQAGDEFLRQGNEQEAGDAYLRTGGQALLFAGNVLGAGAEIAALRAPLAAARAERAGEGVLEAADIARKAETAPPMPMPREIEIPTDLVYRNLASLGDYGTAPPKPAIPDLPLPFKLGEVPQGTPMRGAQHPVSMGQGSIAPPPYIDPARMPVTEEAFLRARQRANDAARTARAAEERGAPFAGAIVNNAARAQDDFAQVERIARGEQGAIPPGILPPQGPRPAPYVAPMGAGGPDVPLGGATPPAGVKIPGLSLSTSQPATRVGPQTTVRSALIPDATPSTDPLALRGVTDDIRGLLRGADEAPAPIANDVPMGTTPVPDDIVAPGREAAIAAIQERVRQAEQLLKSPGLTQESRDAIMRQIARYDEQMDALSSGRALPPPMPTPRATSTTTPINPNRLNSVIPPLALGAGIGGSAALDAADSEEGINPITLAPAIMIGLIGARNLARAGQTSRLVAYEEAERMAAQGASREDIFAKTGWFKGNDQKWRTEIDDSTSTLADDVDDVFSKRASPPWVTQSVRDDQQIVYPPDAPRLARSMGEDGPPFTPFNAFLQDDLSNPGRYPVPDSLRQSLERGLSDAEAPAVPSAMPAPRKVDVVASENPDLIASMAPIEADTARSAARAVIVGTSNGLSPPNIRDIMWNAYQRDIQTSQVRRIYDVGLQAIRQYEASPTPETAAKISDALGVTPEQFDAFRVYVAQNPRAPGPQAAPPVDASPPVAVTKAPPMPPPQAPALDSRRVIDRVRQLASEGALDNEIADAIGIDVEDVVTIRQRNGIQRRFIGSNRNDWDYDPRD